MDDNDITALAKGMVPFVRDCVAEATAVPPELAEQIASAVRMLHESPAIQREAPRPSPRSPASSATPTATSSRSTMINLSETASNAMLDALSPLMDGGSIELRSDDRVLAVLKLADPVAEPAIDGELEFNEIVEEDAALAKGTATSARIVAADGSEIFSCDVGDEDSDAVVTLNTTKIYRGGPVRLQSFRLVMP